MKIFNTGQNHCIFKTIKYELNKEFLFCVPQSFRPVHGRPQTKSN